MKSNRSFVISVLVFLIICGGGILYIWQIESHNVREHQRDLTEITASYANNIQRQLFQSLSATYVLSSLLHRYGTIEDFEKLAAEIIEHNGGISNLQLAPEGVVSEIHPLVGNEKAIGHDLLKDPARRAEALKTMKSMELTLAGPFQLIQGGIAVIGRLPVFLPQDDGSEKFWGFTIVLIRLPKLLHDSNIYSLTETGYDFELSRLDPNTGKRVVFSRSNDTPLPFPVHFEFEVPNGKWKLSICRKKFSSIKLSVFIGYGMTLLFGLMLSILTFLFLKRSEKLKRRTEDLSKINQMLENEINMRKNIEIRLKEVAITDELTGLLNRRGFFTLAEQQCKLANRDKKRISLLYADIDNLKIINDQLGHKEGDQALVNISKIFEKTFRESDIIGRIGGDEFAVLLTGSSGVDIENIMTKHVQDKLRIFNEQSDLSYEISLSIGIALFDPTSPCSIDELLSQADISMYQQKSSKKKS